MDFVVESTTNPALINLPVLPITEVLSPGTDVTVPRTITFCVATEYGIINLKGIQPRKGLKI